MKNKEKEKKERKKNKKKKKIISILKIFPTSYSKILDKYPKNSFTKRGCNDPVEGWRKRKEKEEEIGREEREFYWEGEY